jgi:hypothetical protein
VKSSDSRRRRLYFFAACSSLRVRAAVLRDPVISRRGQGWAHFDLVLRLGEADFLHAAVQIPLTISKNSLIDSTDNAFGVTLV